MLAILALLYCGKFMKTRIAQLDMHWSFPVKTGSTFVAESIRFVMLIFNATQWCSGSSRPPGGPNSFNFMQFLGKFGKIVCWPPQRAGAPYSG